MRQPDIWTVGAIQQHKVTQCVHSMHKGGDLWLPKRPEAHNAFSWKWRFKMAWLVLTGECDVLRWE